MALAIRRSGEGEVAHCPHGWSPSPTAPRPVGQGSVSSPLEGRGAISRKGAKAQRRTTHFPSCHPELVSPSVTTFQGLTTATLKTKTLNQVQGDDAFLGASLLFTSLCAFVSLCEQNYPNLAALRQSRTHSHCPLPLKHPDPRCALFAAEQERPDGPDHCVGAVGAFAFAFIAAGDEAA